jgi:hypothetical protein
MKKREKTPQQWIQWAEEQYAPDRNAIRVGLEAALSALSRGATAEAAITAANDAVRKLQLSEVLDPSDIGISVDGKTHRGRVAGFQSRFEAANVLVWNFRLERTDAAGVALNPIAVEMRGFGFEGAIANGDIVEIRGTHETGKTLRVSAVQNLTSQVPVTARKADSTRGVLSNIIRLIVFLIVFLIFLAVIIFMFVSIQ